MSDVYDLHWKSIPSGEIEPYLTGERGLGRGVYLFVLATTYDTYVGYYVGKGNIRERWAHHVRNWFKNPEDGYSLPKSVDAFLKDPVVVFNQGGPAVRTDETRIQRQRTGRAMLDRTWFCWAEVEPLSGHRIENVEHVVQKALKKHVGIRVEGEIGDDGRFCPASELTIRSFFEPPFLSNVLPPVFTFTPQCSR